MFKKDYINALLDLQGPLKRQGPGDSVFAKHILSRVRDQLPVLPKVIDLGCGTGVTTVLLASELKSSIQAVDTSSMFIQTLNDAIKDKGLDSIVRATTDDFSDLAEVDFATDSYDLLWSEGAAYILGFEQALQTWRPLLKQGGLAVVSELSWFTTQPAQETKDYWIINYPKIALEKTNVERAQAAGFDVLEVIRLPSKAWWDNYYTPLLKRMQQVRMNIGLNAAEIMYEVLDDIDSEIELFSQHSDDYGYSFYILKAR